MRGSTKMMPPIFDHKLQYNYNEISYIIDISFTKLRLCFHNLLHYQQTFSTFAWDAVRWLHKTLCWKSRALHACHISSHHCPQNSILRLHPL